MALGFLCVFTLNHSSSRYIFHELHLITLLVWLSRHNLMQDLKRQLLLSFFFFFVEFLLCIYGSRVKSRRCEAEVGNKCNSQQNSIFFFLSRWSKCWTAKTNEKLSPVTATNMKTTMSLHCFVFFKATRVTALIIQCNANYAGNDSTL